MTIKRQFKIEPEDKINNHWIAISDNENDDFFDFSFNDREKIPILRELLPEIIQALEMIMED